MPKRPGPLPPGYLLTNPRLVMDTFLVNEVALGPITVSEQIATVLAGMLTFGLAVGKGLGG